MKRLAFVFVLLCWCSGVQAQTFQVASRAVTNAELRALPSSPIPLVAAPPFGQVVRIIALSASMNIHAGYANIDPDGYIAIGTPMVDHWYVAFNEGPGNLFLNALLATTEPYYLMGSSPGQLFVRGWGIVPNQFQHGYVSGQPLILKSWNGLGDFTGGDSADTLKITVYYTLEDL